MKEYFWNIFIALTQLLNTLTGGWPDESTSSRVYRLSQAGMPRAKVIHAAIDKLFFWQRNHCKSAYDEERKRYQFPPTLR